MTLTKNSDSYKVDLTEEADNFVWDIRLNIKNSVSGKILNTVNYEIAVFKADLYYQKILNSLAVGIPYYFALEGIKLDFPTSDVVEIKYYSTKTEFLNSLGKIKGSLQENEIVKVYSYIDINDNDLFDSNESNREQTIESLTTDNAIKKIRDFILFDEISNTVNDDFILTKRNVVEGIEYQWFISSYSDAKLIETEEGYLVEVDCIRKSSNNRIDC